MTSSSDTQPLATIHSHPASPTATAAPHSPRVRGRRRGLRWLISIAVTAIVVAGIGILGIMALIYWQARTDEARPADAIVVLGAAQYNGRPSPVFQARLEHALDLYNQGLAPVVVVTGGKSPGDQFTEGETAEAWLIDRGVPQEAIRVEWEGRSTWESLQGIPAVYAPEEGDRVIAVSDGFHLFRSELMLRELGYSAYSSAAPGSPIEQGSPTEFGYIAREAGAVLVFLPEMLFG